MSVTVSREEFEAMVERAIAGIPGRFRNRMENLFFAVEAWGPGRDLLGLYEGRPLTERSVSDPFGLPDRIRIFQKPHEEMARSREELEQIVADTVWHEVGHYFGLNEFEIARVEARRQRLRALRGRARAYNQRR
jgi:predicted Zn-dependent protease with MMP-like domain